jgi:hypothetical protein
MSYLFSYQLVFLIGCSIIGALTQVINQMFA